MLRILGPARATCDGVSRRDLLRAGALTLFGGLTLTDAVSARSGVQARARSVILIDLFGGPSHIDTFDPKPNAPKEVRGEFGTITSALPGVRVCEHLPLLAARLDRTTLIRTLSHGYNSHNPYAVMTGFTGGSDVVDYFAKPTNHPSMGSVCHYAGLGRPGVPPYVVLPAVPGYSGGLRRAGPYGGYLGSAYDPLFSTCDPRFSRPVSDNDAYDPSFRPMGDPTLPSLQPELTLDALDRRRTLLEQLDGHAARMDPVPTTQLERRRRQAFELLLSKSARSAFDLTTEPPRLRDRYGRDLWGSSLLLARRLVEAGVTYVTVHTESKGNGHWDTHNNNFKMLSQWLLPFLDTAVSALLEDLDDRGLLSTTLVLVMGDMGRTPRVNGAAGRDHWPQCGFCLLAGGGTKQGYVHGTTDATAAFPKDHPVSPGDLAATVYEALGLDSEMTVPDQLGRPVHVCHGGRPVQAVFG
jgi:hypothetical protein